MERFDSELANLTYRRIRSEQSSTNVEQLLSEYIEVCAGHAADLIPRTLHTTFIHQVDLMRGLLTTVRPNQSSAHQQQLGHQAPTVIVKHEWSKEHYKKMRQTWNAALRELTPQVTEAAVAWLLGNREYEGFDEWIFGTSKLTCYVPSLGIVMQKWSDRKSAKKYVDALHIAINAPLSKFYTPCALCTEILGTSIVAMSLCPVDAEWSAWREAPYVHWALDAISTSVRLTKLAPLKSEAASPTTASTSPAGGVGTNSAAATRANAEAQAERAISISEASLPDVHISAGCDGRWYVLDLRSVAIRPMLGTDDVADLLRVAPWPRRELLFSAGGVISTPYTPHEFILKFKLKIVADQLLNIGGAGAPGPADQSLISTLMHFHGVSFGAYISPLFGTILEQERVFLAGIQTSNRKTAAIAPNSLVKLKRFALCKSFVISEVIARAIKRFIRDEWRRIARSKNFVQLLLEAVNEGGDDDDPDSFDVDAEQKLQELNRPFIDAANFILQSIFVVSSNSSAGRAASANATTGNDETATADPLSLKNANKNSALHLSIDPNMLESLLFVANDLYLGNAASTSSSSLSGGKPPTRFTSKEEDIDIARVVFCLSEMLRVNISLKPRKIQIDATTDLFSEDFFDLEGVSNCALRTEPYTTTIDVPICLVTGSKAKLTDFVDLQQRIASKILTTIDASQSPIFIAHLLCVVKFILLYANDVQVAQRGLLQEHDYDDLARVHGQVPSRSTPHAQKMVGCFEAVVAFRRAWLLAKVDLQGALKHLMRAAERSRPLFESPTGSATILLDKIGILCAVCEHFMVSGMELVTSLDMALQDLNQLVRANDTRGGLARLGRLGHADGELRLVFVYQHQLALLSLLVKHVLNHSGRSQSDAIGQAVKFCAKRRDVIAEVFGERSVEAGLACNDVAAICSNNKYDFEAAQEEFERAVVILREAQPEGPALFVTMNNLAFLYFRKAERMRKNPQLARDELQKESGGQLLVKAEELLMEVMAAEGNVSVLDYAAALNNLASIKLFMNQFGEARKYFTKTLEFTEHLARDSDNELPCRAHAIKNMKVLARKQYVAAVLKVQANVRRFIAKLQNQRNVTLLRAAKPLQRLGRGLITRVFLAKHYRFSAFHWWVRKPRLFTLRLDSSFHPLPLVARREVWEDQLQNTARRIQRCMLGFRARRFCGMTQNFSTAHFGHRRPALLKEMHRRRALMFSGESLRLLLVLGTCAMTELLDTKLKCTRYAAYIAVGDTHRMEMRGRRELLTDQCQESARYALSQTQMRVFGALLQHERQDLFSTLEQESRRAIVEEWLVAVHASFTFFFWAMQQIDFRCSIIHNNQRSRLELLELRMRSNITVEYVALVRGEFLVRLVPRIGRGFLTRKWLHRMRHTLCREDLLRREIIAEEASCLHMPSIAHTLKRLTIEDTELYSRKAITDDAISYFEVQEQFSDIAVVLQEFNTRATLEGEAQTEWKRNVVDTKARDLVEIEERIERTNAILVEESVEFVRGVLMHAEELELLEIAAYYNRETLQAIQRSVAFARTVLDRHEALERSALTREEETLFTVILAQQEHHDRALRIPEQHEWSELLSLIDDTIRQQMLTETKRAQDEMARQVLMRHEAAPRAAIVLEAFAEDFWKPLVTRFFDDLARILWSECVARYNLLVQEEWLVRYFDVTLSRSYLMLQLELSCGLLGSTEWLARVLLCAEHEREVVEALCEPSRASLELIIQNFISSATDPDGNRLPIVQAEERERCELEAYGGFVALLGQFVAADVYYNASAAQIELMERGFRASIVAQVHNAERKLLELAICVRVDAHQRQLMTEYFAFPLDHIVVCEGLWRATVLAREERHAWARLIHESTQAEVRVLIRREESIHFIGLVLWHKHAQIISTAFFGRGLPELLRLYAEFASGREAIHYNRAMAMLCRCLDGFSVRRSFGRLQRRRLGSVLLLQRIGRAYHVRQRTSLRFAEEVEHCYLYATEMCERHRIVKDEQKEFELVAKFRHFAGCSFLRSFGRLPSAGRLRRSRCGSFVQAARSHLSSSGPTPLLSRRPTASPQAEQQAWDRRGSPRSATGLHTASSPLSFFLPASPAVAPVPAVGVGTGAEPTDDCYQVRAPTACTPDVLANSAISSRAAVAARSGEPRHRGLRLRHARFVPLNPDAAAAATTEIPGGAGALTHVGEAAADGGGIDGDGDTNSDIDGMLDELDGDSPMRNVIAVVRPVDTAPSRDGTADKNQTTSILLTIDGSDSGERTNSNNMSGNAFGRGALAPQPSPPPPEADRNGSSSSSPTAAATATPKAVTRARTTLLFEAPAWQSTALFQARHSNPIPPPRKKLADVYKCLATTAPPPSSSQLPQQQQQEWKRSVAGAAAAVPTIATPHSPLCERSNPRPPSERIERRLEFSSPRAPQPPSNLRRRGARPASAHR